MNAACTLAVEPRLRYSETRLADLHGGDPDLLADGYPDRQSLYRSARHSYRLFEGRACPVCGGSMGGEFRLLFRRSSRHTPGERAQVRWHRAFDVRLDCDRCGHHDHSLLANGPLFDCSPAAGGEPLMAIRRSA